MKYAIIENGVVTNIVKADADFAATQGWIEVSDGAEIGGTYADGVFTPKPAPEPEPVDPNTYTIHAAWLKAYLRSQGWEAELNGIVDTAGPVAQALWESGSTYRVNDKLVVDLWAEHSQSANNTVQDVFNAAAELRDASR